MTNTNLQHAQEVLNDFFTRRLRGYSPIRVDGQRGVHTNQRILAAKYFLGYGKDRDDRVSVHFLRQLGNPMDPRHFKEANDGDYKLGLDRRAHHNKVWEEHQHPGAPAEGLVWQDGHWVAGWIADINVKVRHDGWPGWVLSGWRDPLYSQHLCEVMCGAPTCPGRCAGLTSRHVGRIFPEGAVDVTYYDDFNARLHKLGLWGVNERGKICNDLPRDLPHHSADGH